MNDRETIIRVLNEIANDKRMLNHADYWALICAEAAELLKAQEPVKPVMCTAHAQGAEDVWYECSKCGGFLSVNWNGVKVCKKCGRAVKWDG